MTMVSCQSRFTGNERRTQCLDDCDVDGTVRADEDLQGKRPIRKKWRNFSKLSGNEYHRHLSYPWVACWRIEKQVLEIEAYYAGSRQNAPHMVGR